MKSFIREKKIYCGKEYVEVDLIPRTQNGDKTVKGKRSKKTKISETKQKNLNDKNSKRYLVQLGNGNFGKGDFHVTLTYTEDNLPDTVEAAEREVANYLRRIKNRRKKEGAGELKYILVTEYKFTTDNKNKPKRIHHHVIMNGGLDRNILEDLWCKRRKRGEKEPELIGYVNADRIQVNENGIEALCKYIIKDPQGKKRWSSSRNLERPYFRTNDNKYSKRKIERLAKDANSEEEFKKLYPQYEITNIQTEYYEDTGWHIYLHMWKRKVEV